MFHLCWFYLEIPNPPGPLFTQTGWGQVGGWVDGWGRKRGFETSREVWTQQQVPLWHTRHNLKPPKLGWNLLTFGSPGAFSTPLKTFSSRGEWGVWTPQAPSILISCSPTSSIHHSQIDRGGQKKRNFNWLLSNNVFYLTLFVIIKKTYLCLPAKLTWYSLLTSFKLSVMVKAKKCWPPFDK